MKSTSQTLLRKADNPELYEYSCTCMELSRRLYNAALFRLRQNFTGRGKESPTANERQILDEIELTIRLTNKARPKSCISYTFLEKMMRVTENPDFFAGLPMQTAQEVLKQAVRDFKGWLSSLSEYRKNPSAFTGKPKMPKYKKPDTLNTVTYTNQDCVIYGDSNSNYMKMPKTNAAAGNVYIPEGGRLMEVKIKPYYGHILLLCTFDLPDRNAPSPGPYACGLDFGVSNTVALVSNNGLAILYKGGFIKSTNQWYNKRTSELKSIAMKGKDPSKAKGDQYIKTAQLDALSLKRANTMRDAMHKISADIVQTCLENRIGTIVMGSTKGWKQGSDMGSKGNQNFIQIPVYMLQRMITYKAERAGILVIRREESYTSKADLIAMDPIPVYGEEGDGPAAFSGKRVSRGMYRSSSGMLINADVNGVGNILRKEIPDAFDGIVNFAFLQNVRVHDVLPHVKSKAKRPRHSRRREVLAAA